MILIAMWFEIALPVAVPCHSVLSIFESLNCSSFVSSFCFFIKISSRQEEVSKGKMK